MTRCVCNINNVQLHLFNFFNSQCLHSPIRVVPLLWPCGRTTLLQHKLLASSLSAAAGNLNDLTSKLETLTQSRQRAEAAVASLATKLQDVKLSLEKEKGRLTLVVAEGVSRHPELMGRLSGILVIFTGRHIHAFTRTVVQGQLSDRLEAQAAEARDAKKDHEAAMASLQEMIDRHETQLEDAHQEQQKLLRAKAEVEGKEKEERLRYTDLACAPFR